MNTEQGILNLEVSEKEEQMNKEHGTRNDEVSETI
jgi:hypothetical protein